MDIDCSYEGESENDSNEGDGLHFEEPNVTREELQEVNDELGFLALAANQPDESDITTDSTLFGRSDVLPLYDTNR